MGLRLNWERVEDLEEIAKLERTNVNAIICSLVYDYIEKYKKHNEIEAAKMDKWLKGFDKLSVEEQKSKINEMKIEAFDRGVTLTGM